MYRLKAKYLHGGAQSIAHGNRCRKPAHALTDPLRQHVQHLYQERYYGSHCTHFTELLAEYENIRLSVSSVRRILIQGGLRPARVRRHSVGQPAPLTTFGQAIADSVITHIDAEFRKPKDAASGFGEPFRIVWCSNCACATYAPWRKH